MAGREQHEARRADRVDVRREGGEDLAVAGLQIQLDAVGTAEDVALGLQRQLVPVLEALEVAVVLLEIRRHPQEPGRTADQSHRVVAAPAATVLDL